MSRFNLTQRYIKSGFAQPVKFIIQVTLGYLIGYWLGGNTGGTIGIVISVISFILGEIFQVIIKKDDHNNQNNR